MKIIRWLSDNILFVYTIFLLIFIPLYPKIPLIGVERTFVYVRLDDFAVALGVALYLLQLVRKKAHLKTPLTIPIIIFWLVGAIATLNGVIFIFPSLLGVFRHLAFLEWLRYVEYASVFFIAYSAIKDKKHIHFYVGTIAATLLAVVGYGFGQRFLGWPAFLTMNEQFAKGIPLKLSPLDRIPSTFAGHYDLAAYLVLIITLLGSMVIGYKKWYVKIALFISAALGVVLLMMTQSRVSFVAYLFAVVFMLILQKKKWFIIPVLILSFLLLREFSGLSSRLGSTLTQANVVVDARTGKPIGIAQTIDQAGKQRVVVNQIQQTGESLPQGSGYITLPSTNNQTTQSIIKKEKINSGTASADINIRGNFVIKKVFAYDVSFTTRFQGEWPRAIEAFQRNLLFGSGYSSISLATDNNYLRMLGETGLLGIASFLLIFLIAGIYAYRVLPLVHDKVARSFVLGVIGGMVGLALNATLIDVFSASKDAYVMWMLVGLSVAILYQYQKEKIDMLKQLRKILTSPVAMTIYLLVLAVAFYAQSVSNYFVADDFVWLRNVADCQLTGCAPVTTTIIHFFTKSPDFFYRPATLLYFYIMYAIFGLNSGFYHAASIFLLFLSAASIFIVTRYVLKNNYFAFLTAVGFMVLSGHYEAIIWISAVGHLAASTFALMGLAGFVLWREQKRLFFLILSFLFILIAPFFHEFGVIAPLFVVIYDLVWYRRKEAGAYLRRWYDFVFILIIPLYLVMKLISHSWWSHGDYSYNFVKLPFNVVGNLIGYVLLLLFGTHTLPLTESLRVYGRSNMLLFGVLGVVVTVIIAGIFYFVFKKTSVFTGRIVLLSVALFIIPLLPFLGLGIITSRYSYLSAFGILLLLVYLLQKGHELLRKRNKNFALGVVLVVTLLFVIFEYRELMRINSDWQKAGEISNNLLSDFSNAYNNPNIGSILPQNNTFYFINVPKTYGEAWVFPDGLRDALWFTFQDKNLTVHESSNVNQALKSAAKAVNGKVFEIENNGHISQIVQTQVKVNNPVKKK